jgi:hypothetical protein
LYGKAIAVGQVLDLSPSRPTLHAYDLALAIEGNLVEPAHVENEAASRKSLPSHAVTLSRYRYLEVVVAGKGQGVGHILYALDILTIPKTGVLFKQLASLMKPSFASNDSGFGGGVKIRVVGLELVGSAGKTKSQFFSRSGGNE